MIKIKSEEEIRIMRDAGKILATTLRGIEKQVKPGITTLELDRAAEALILSLGAKPGFKGHEGFPYSLCASVNENVVHGYPSNYILKIGDIGNTIQRLVEGPGFNVVRILSGHGIGKELQEDPKIPTLGKRRAGET